MKKEHIVIWNDPMRDEDKEDKAAGLLEHLGQYDVDIVMTYEWAPMVLVQTTDEQLKTLQNDEELIVEENGEVYVMGNTNLRPGKMGNCS